MDTSQFIQLYCQSIEGYETIKARGNNTIPKFLGKRHGQSFIPQQTKQSLFNWEKLASSLT
jgi:hypothetical protein